MGGGREVIGFAGGGRAPRGTLEVDVDDERDGEVPFVEEPFVDIAGAAAPTVGSGGILYRAAERQNDLERWRTLLCV